jgi:two-component system, chemotaxis family, chemotaxis protein CheY
MTHRPRVEELDGIRIDRYKIGLVYEVPATIGNVFLAEGWAEPEVDEVPGLVLPRRESSAILVVDDDEDMRTIAVELLSMTGHPVVTAENGREALRMLRESRPALVLLDLMMPVMDGWEFREEQLKMADRSLAMIPVVLLTAVPDAEKYMRELHAVDVVSKPVENLDVLVDTVKRWLHE